MGAIGLRNGRERSSAGRRDPLVCRLLQACGAESGRLNQTEAFPAEYGTGCPSGRNRVGDWRGKEVLACPNGRRTRQGGGGATHSLPSGEVIGGQSEWKLAGVCGLMLSLQASSFR